MAESERWVARWPLLEIAWQRRLEAATGLDELPAETVIAIADAALDARKRAFDDYYRPELRHDVARLYLKHGVRLDQVQRLATEPLEDEIAWARAYMDDNPAGPPSEKSLRDFETNLPRRFAEEIWKSNVLLAHWAWRSRDGDILKKSLAALQEAAPAAPEGADKMRVERFARKRTELNLAQAWSADARGDVEAALAAYAEAVRSRPRFTEKTPYSVQGDPYFGEAVREQARLFWGAHGRSDADLEAAVGEASGVSIGSRRDHVTWFKGRAGARLPADFRAVDLNGRTWTRADFFGVSGVLAIWPADYDSYGKSLASLAAGLGPKTPMLALALGGNAAMFEQIAKREKLTFAIAPANLPLVLRLTQGTTAPQVWIVNARGDLVKQAIGPFPIEGTALAEFQQALDEAR